MLKSLIPQASRSVLRAPQTGPANLRSIPSLHIAQNSRRGYATPSEPYDVIVIGAGPGGYVAATMGMIAWSQGGSAIILRVAGSQQAWSVKPVATVSLASFRIS